MSRIVEFGHETLAGPLQIDTRLSTPACSRCKIFLHQIEVSKQASY